MTRRGSQPKADPAHPAQLAGKLVHDVGKYISRTARNLTDREVTPTLLSLLLADLYATDGANRASELFEKGVGALGRHLEKSRPIERCRKLLKEIDDLETRVREGEPDAAQRAAAMAVEVDDRLREVAREIAKVTP